MKHRIGSVTVEAIDTYVRVTVENIGGIGANPIVKCTQNECPESIDVAQVLAEIRGYWPDNAHLMLCGRGADDARANRDLSSVNL